ncbi:Cna B-type domain-containing protein, partial [Klebsiella pneumoniae]|uniref:Cna B-type domain-containing protein n=1 Tax=Klebsiella pneumoniae TaxID=573 RepID=UPI0025A23DF8
SATVTAEEDWSWSFTDLPKFAAGRQIVYSVAEEAVAGYTAAVNGYNVTNIHTPEVIDIEGTKTWDDADDQDGLRPGSITV